MRLQNGWRGGFNLGRSSEILRDELKFTKFVGRLRHRFSRMFDDMLKTQLIEEHYHPRRLGNNE